MLAADLFGLDFRQRFGGKPTAEAAAAKPLEEVARVAHAEAARAVGSLDGGEEVAQGVFQSLSNSQDGGAGSCGVESASVCACRREAVAG